MDLMIENMQKNDPPNMKSLIHTGLLRYLY